MKNVKLVAFDCDGVIFDTEAAQEGQRLSKEFLKALRNHIDPNELRKIFRKCVEAGAHAIEAKNKKVE